MSNEFGYIPESPEQSFGNNKGIFTPTDIYDLTRADKYTNYGQLELIETQTLTNSLTLDFTSIKETEYNVHLIVMQNVGYQAQAQAYKWQFYESGVLESSTVYQWANHGGTVGGTFYEDRSTGDSGIRIDNTTSQAIRMNCYTYFYNLGNSAVHSLSTMHWFNERSTATVSGFAFGSGMLPQASAVDGIRFLCTGSTNLTSGTFSLYGIKEYS